MYINFWYPVCSAAELNQDAPLRAKILGLDFVAWRDDEGAAHLLADTCAHRGGSLSRGKRVAGRLACPYHGWQYAGDGHCAHIPVLGEDGKIPARAKVDSYPVIERYGIVFAFLGDEPEDSRPPLMEILEWGQAGWRTSVLSIIELDAYFERSIENGLDPVHNEFVHDSQGNIQYKQGQSRMETEDWGCRIHVYMEPPKPGTTKFEALREDDKPEHFGAYSYHHGPNCLETRINLSKDNSFVQYFWEQPVDGEHTRIFFINMRNCMLDPENDERVTQVNLNVAAEDVAIVNALKPKRTPESSAKEILITGDECIGEYRRFLKAWEDNGWRMDMKKVRQDEGDIVYTVPCPARRTEKNWVLDSVPVSRSIEGTA